MTGSGERECGVARGELRVVCVSNLGDELSEGNR